MADASLADIAIEPLDSLLRGASLHSVFQPIVALDSRRVMGYEALIRGPAGHPLERPDQLFEAAAAAGRTSELDWHCRAAALQQARAAGLSQTLFLNVETMSLGTACPEHLISIIDDAIDFPLVIELTERHLVDRAPAVLRAAELIRERGLGLALDDVGANRETLALLPFVRPDVIKLDLALIQDRDSAHIGAVIHACLRQAELTGAVVLAEGIETEEHFERALVAGAELGQGWLFGHPGAIGPAPTDPDLIGPPRVQHPVAVAKTTPFPLVTARRQPRIATKRQLLATSESLQAKALALGAPPTVLTSMQHARHYDGHSGAHIRELARRSALVVALADDLERRSLGRVHASALTPNDPLCQEWDVVVMGLDFSAALVAHDLGDTGPEAERRYEYAITYDRDLVIAAGDSLLARALASGSGDDVLGPAPHRTV